MFGTKQSVKRKSLGERGARLFLALVLAAGCGGPGDSVEAEPGTRAASLTSVSGFAAVTRLRIEPYRFTLAKGESKSFHAIATYADGRELDVSYSARWSLSSRVGSSVASIGSGGSVTAKNTGVASISAELGSYGAGASLYVSGPKLWIPITPPVTGSAFKSVWGTSDRDVWVVGESASILHWDGLRWSKIPSGLAFPWNLNSVRGTGPSDVWVTGRNAILHWDGSRFTPLALPSTADETYEDVWPSAANDVWFVSTTRLNRWDGSKFTAVPLAAGEYLHAAWGSGPSDLWVAGMAGRLLRVTGATAAADPFGFEGLRISRMGGFGSDVWAVAPKGKVFRYDGSAWTSQRIPVPSNLLSVWARSASEVWATSDDGKIFHWDGATWTSVWTPAFLEIFGIWGSGNTVWAVGRDGVLMQYQY